jgi:hypothetical protein
MMPGETANQVSGWTIDTAMVQMQRQHNDLEALLEERYQTQTKAVDAAFSAQQLAMTTALAAAERAVQTALVSAEKAVIKAEAAADKRFEAVNEFRQTLSDQTATFATREALDSQATSLNARLRELTALVAANSGRIDAMIGQKTGGKDAWMYLVGFIGMAVGLAGIIFAITGR